MHVSVITIFPQQIQSFMQFGVPRIAVAKTAMAIEAVDLRDFSEDRHRRVDDRPFGGGPGMVLCPEPVFAAVEAVEARSGAAHKILLTPRGRRLDQEKLRVLSRLPRLLILCGHYEGVDERVLQGFDWDEISLGDFVLSGGEVAALVLIDGLARLLPTVLGDPASADDESFEKGLLEAPQFTRPRSFRGMDVPEVLLSGDHQAVDRWRRDQSLKATAERRADLLAPRADDLSPE